MEASVGLTPFRLTVETPDCPDTSLKVAVSPMLAEPARPGAPPPFRSLPLVSPQVELVAHEPPVALAHEAWPEKTCAVYPTVTLTGASPASPSPVVVRVTVPLCAPIAPNEPATKRLSDTPPLNTVAVFPPATWMPLSAPPLPTVTRVFALSAPGDVRLVAALPDEPTWMEPKVPEVALTTRFCRTLTVPLAVAVVGVAFPSVTIVFTWLAHRVVPTLLMIAI